MSSRKPTRMKSAWVITREGLSHEMEVISILSSRKSADRIKEMVEWLYALLYYSPHEHIAMGRYSDPLNPYPAVYWTTNTGTPVLSKMVCGHDPILVARLAKEVEFLGGEENSSLRWTEPDRLQCDCMTGRITDRIPGHRTEASIHLPLHLS